MDLVSLGFLIVMILAGGVVALVADKLGRTLGKKRLTLFNMRPRHTATTITVVAGMLIPLITVLFVAAVSKDAREWIVEGHKALARLNVLQSENQNLETQKELTATEIAGLKKQKEQTLTDLLAVQDKLRLATNEVRGLQVKQALLVKEISRNQILISEYQTQLRSKQQMLLVAATSLKKAQTDLASESKALAMMRTSYAELDRQRQQANDEYVKVSGQNDQLTKANSDLTGLNANLKDQIDESQKKLATTQADEEFARLQLDEEKTNLAQAIAQRDLITNLVSANQLQPRTSHIVFNITDELARVSVPAGTDAQTAKQLYDSLMNEAAQVAESSGAKENKSHEIVSLFPPVDDNGQQLPPDLAEQNIISGVTNNKVDQVLVATADLNTYAGEPVPLDVEFHRNPIIYKRDEKIAEVMINGDDPEDKILQRISDFITGPVKQQALKDHMIPIAGQEDTFGEVPIADLLEVAHSIKDANRPMRLTALADADTHAADPLRLHFRVR